MTADVDGSDIQIAFNARYVLDALGVIGEDEVELLFDGPLSPGLLRPPGKEHYLYVIMPVRCDGPERGVQTPHLHLETIATTPS